MKATLSNLIDQRPENKTIDQIILKNFRNNQGKFSVARNLRCLAVSRFKFASLKCCACSFLCCPENEIVPRLAEY